MAMDPAEALLVRAFNECQESHGHGHRRCLKELVKCRRECGSQFTEKFKRCVFPIFISMKKEPAVERLVKFIISFVTYRDANTDDCDAFFESFTEFLLAAVDASNKCVRYRSCQLLSEIILALAEDAQVSEELWDEMTASMQRRIKDKLAGIRLFAARALSRLSSAENDELEDSSIRHYRVCLSSDPSSDVRKVALMAIPVSNETISDIVEKTADVSAVVRKTAFFVIGEKLPISSLSIRQRTLVLQRGLLDREPAPCMECKSMLKDKWLSKDCNMDVLALLKYLDVETNEKVGELVMQELLKDGMVEFNKIKSLKSYLAPADCDAGTHVQLRLMEPEEALYWRALCAHLSSEEQTKNAEAASARGAYADVVEAEAADKAQLLDAILPSTVDDFVALVEAHHNAGASHAFSSRQLLMLASVLDFSDTASRKSAGSLIRKTLCEWTGNLESDPNTLETVGDVVYIGADKEWSDAVVQLARKVHASPGAFVEAIAQAVVESGKPCREGGASVREWLQCLAVTGILLENLKSLRQFPVHIMETKEMVDGLLIPAIHHLNSDVQRAAVRCLSLCCQLDEQPSERLVQEVVAASDRGSAGVKTMAVKGLMDFVMRHGAAAMRQMVNTGAPSHGTHEETGQHQQARQVPLLQLLVDILVKENESNVQEEDGESAKSVAAEGFAKLLLQSNRFPNLEPVEANIFMELLRLFFDERTKDLARLRQCLSVFFPSYASLAPEHKQCISRSFIPLMREEWHDKKSAAQQSRFILELLNQPLYSQSKSKDDENGSIVDDDSPDEGHEYLALQIGSELVRMAAKKSAPAKAYKSTLCKVLTSLKFRPAKQKEIKCVRKQLDWLVRSVEDEKLLLKELNTLSAELQKIDQTSDQVLEPHELESLLASLEINIPAETARSAPKTPAPRTASCDSSDSSDSESFQTPQAKKTQAVHRSVQRSQRTCKTVAIKRMESIHRTRYDSE